MFLSKKHSQKNNRMKNILSILIIFTLITSKAIGQELLISIPHQMEGLAFNISKANVIAHEQSNLKFVLLSSNNQVTLYSINDNNEITSTQSTKIPGYDSYTILGSQFNNNTLTILLFSGTNYYLESFNINTNEHYEASFKIKKKGESSFLTLQLNNQIAFISYHKKDGHFILRTLNKDLQITKQYIPFNHGNFKSFFKLWSGLNSPTTIHPDWNYRPKQSTGRLQLSFDNSYVNYLFQHEDSLRNIHIDIENLNIDYYTESSKLPDGYGKYNHIVYNDKLFSIFSHSTKIKLQVKDLKTGQILDHKTFTNTNTFNDWFSEPNLNGFPVNQLNNKTKEEQFIKRLNKFKPILSVSNSNTDYVIRMGGLRKEYQSNSYGSRIPVFKEEYVQEMWLDENFNIKNTQTITRAIKQILNYRIPINKPQGITKLKYKDSYIIGYYDVNTERYILKNFKDKPNY